MLKYEQVYESLLNKINSSDVKGNLPTEKELTCDYGVSRITVRKALSMLVEQGLISRTAGKGSEIIDNKGRKKVIGVVLCDVDSAFGLDTLLAIEKYAYNNNCYIIFKRSFDNPKIEEQVLKEMVQLKVDGLIIQSCHGDITKELLNLYSKGLPIVCIDRVISNLPISSVSTDNVSASRLATDYLVQLKHNKILLVSSNPNIATSLQNRLAGFTGSCIANGKTVSKNDLILNIKSPLLKTEKSRKEDKENIKKRLIENNDVTAIVTTERRVSLIVQEVLFEMGKSCPKDYALVTFDHEPVYGTNYTVTHIKQNQDEIGKTAVEQLINQINGSSDIKHIEIPATLIVGKST